MRIEHVLTSWLGTALLLLGTVSFAAAQEPPKLFDDDEMPPVRTAEPEPEPLPFIDPTAPKPNPATPTTDPSTPAPPATGAPTDPRPTPQQDPIPSGPVPRDPVPRGPVDPIPADPIPGDPIPGDPARSNPGNGYPMPIDPTPWDDGRIDPYQEPSPDSEAGQPTTTTPSIRFSEAHLHNNRQLAIAVDKITELDGSRTVVTIPPTKQGEFLVANGESILDPNAPAEEGFKLPNIGERQTIALVVALGGIFSCFFFLSRFMISSSKRRSPRSPRS